VCSATHVLLPEVALPRRADASRVVGAGLEIAAAGLGHRRIAAVLGLPADTVRGWIRRFRHRAQAVRSLFMTVLVTMAWDPVVPGPCGSPLADAVAAIAAAAEATRRRLGLLGLERWSFACRASRGTVLAVDGF
jgi:hypothetical protein